MKKGDKVYVLKYALTQGMIRGRVTDVAENFVYVRLPDAWFDVQCKKRDVVKTVAEARPVVVAMARDKIASHERALSKLRKTLEVWMRARDGELPVKDGS